MHHTLNLPPSILTVNPSYIPLHFWSCCSFYLECHLPQPTPTSSPKFLISPPCSQILLVFSYRDTFKKYFSLCNIKTQMPLVPQSPSPMLMVMVFCLKPHFPTYTWLTPSNILRVSYGITSFRKSPTNAQTGLCPFSGLPFYLGHASVLVLAITSLH